MPMEIYLNVFIPNEYLISDMQVTPEVSLDAMIAKLSIRKTKNIANIFAFDIW